MLNKRLAIAVTAALAVAAALSGCDLLGFKNWTWHQKLTLEVATPQGTVSGGSVVAVEAGTSPKWVPAEDAGGMGATVTGEASFVEVAPGRYLFALLGGELDRTLSMFLPELSPDSRKKAERLQTLRETREVPRKLYPLLVTFTDINNPKTVRKVDPANLAASFGPGVSLRRMTLTITDEEVTIGHIESILPWWCKLRAARARLNGKNSIAIADNDLSNNLGTGEFKVGDCR